MMIEGANYRHALDAAMSVSLHFERLGGRASDVHRYSFQVYAHRKPIKSSNRASQLTQGSL